MRLFPYRNSCNKNPLISDADPSWVVGSTAAIHQITTHDTVYYGKYEHHKNLNKLKSAPCHGTRMESAVQTYGI